MDYQRNPNYVSALGHAFFQKAIDLGKQADEQFKPSNGTAPDHRKARDLYREASRLADTGIAEMAEIPAWYQDFYPEIQMVKARISRWAISCDACVVPF